MSLLYFTIICSGSASASAAVPRPLADFFCFCFYFFCACACPCSCSCSGSDSASATVPRPPAVCLASAARTFTSHRQTCSNACIQNTCIPSNAYIQSMCLHTYTPGACMLTCKSTPTYMDMCKRLRSRKLVMTTYD
jgi:hypothetical protein